jgi:hypothetical protein
MLGVKAIDPGGDVIIIGAAAHAAKIPSSCHRRSY